MPSGVRLVSASSEFGVCVPNDDDGGLFRATHTVTCSLDVPAASPGNRVTATITVIAPDPGTLTTMFSLVTGAADPDSTNNTVSSTTVVRTVGGRAFGIALAPAGGVLLTWATGQAQAGYFVGRLVDGVHTVYPKNGVPLPPGATSFVDAAPVPGRTNCYVVSPIDGTGAEIGRSELLCIVPGSESGAGASLQFTLRVFQINQVGAGLTWRPPGGQTSYWLGTHDVESGDSGGRTLAATATSFAELTFGRATCYQLVPLNGSTAMMRSPLACVVPGYGTLP
jgi:hypothetical protein